uniref:VWFA domain-containing protein n=1 Tax=Rhabditophanes sp. KR3021 TaxID=114890 RepID=A0AC35U605_9BILA
MSSAESKSDDLSDVKKEQYAKEVVLMMNKDLRVSRNIRAVWFFEHFDEQFQIDDTSKNWDQKELIICGIIPEGENGKRNVENEKFLLGPDTMITYLADMYKLVYVLDLSPSAFVAVGKKGDLLWNRILPALEASIKKTMQPFILPGSSKKFVPKLQISICVYNSYLALPQDQVLLQGIYLREMKDIDKMLEVIRKKLEILINHQMRHGTSFVSTWSNHKAKLTKSHLKKAAELRRMKYKNYRLINGKFYYDSHRRLRVREEYSSSSEEDEKDKKEEKMRIQYNFKDKGFIRSSWALIFMLRLGLLGTKMMNDNTPSNIIIISDGVCGVPDIKAVQTILTQLRGCTVSCSFIDLQNKNEEDPCFGHMSYPEVFQFFAGATYGTFMYANEINNVRVTDYRNTFHEAFLFWSFQKTIAYENAAEDFVATLSSEYLDFGHKGEFRHRFSFETYTITLRQLLYVRLREGFTLKSVEIDKAYNKENHVKIKKFEIITVVLCQPWKPQITLEYVITTKWMGKITHMSETTVEIYVIAPYKFLVDLFKSSKSDESALSVWNNPFELLRNTIQDILFADKLLLRLHAFMHDNQYIVPHELTDRNNCLFGVEDDELFVMISSHKKNSIEYNSVHDEKNVELFTTDDGPSNLTKSLSTSEESIILNENAGLSPRHIYEETEQIVTTEKRCLEIFEKPTDRILIKHKETPDIYDPLTRDLADEVELWRRKVVITNSLKKYLCCRSSIYQISPCHENIRCIQPNQLEYILHTIIYRRLNQGFSFAYGVDGVVNMVRQATKTMNNDGQSVPCVQQFIIQAPESYKAVLEKELCTNYSKQKVKIQKNETTKETEKKAAYEKFYEEDGSKFDYQLTFEAWTEPDDWTDKKKNKKTNNLNAKYPEEYESPKLIEEVNQIMKVMLTMDVIMTATTNKQMNYNNPLIFPINAIDDTQKKCDPDELYIKKYTDSYDMESLCRHAPERAIILFPCLGKDKNDPDSIDRTKSLLEVLHYEIDKEFDLCIKQPGSEYWHSQLGQVKKILDDEVLDLNLVENSLFEDQVLLKAPFKKKLTRSKSFNDLVEYKDLCKKVNPAFISERQLNLLYLKCDPDEYVPPKRCTRYYARRWSPSSIVLIALPDTIYDILDLNGKAITNKSAIPVCVYYIDESFLTDIMIHEEPKERFSPLIDFRYQRPHDDLSCRLRQMTQKTREEIRKKIVVPWYSNPRIEKLAYSYDVTFDFADFCNNFEEFTYSRAYVLSVYSALCNSKYVPEHVLKHMVEERCQEASREIVEYNEKLRIFCEHFDQNKKDGCVYDSDLHSISYSCVKEKTEFKLNFEHLKKRKSKFFKSPNESDSTSSSDENDPTLRNENHRESDTFDGTLDDATFDDDKSEISNVTMELEELKNSKCNNLLTIKTPIFVQLICAITLPNGEMVTFPASSIPNCIMDVLNMAPTEIGFNEMASMIDKIKVTIDMYIFTCPISQDIVRSKNQPYNYFVEDKIIVNQNFQVLNENVNDKKLDVTKIKDLDDEYSYSFGVQEFKILSQLYSDINYFIDSEEYFLMIRRVPKIFKRHELDKITNFTSTFSRGKSSLLDNRLKYSFKESDFVVKQEKILQGMIERFPTFDVEYLRMIGDYDKENDSLVFYCCEIANKERFKNLFKEGYSLYHSDNESLLSESEATREASIQCYSEPIKPTDCDSLIIDKPILDLENTLSSQLRQEYADPSTNMVDTNFWIMVLFKNNQIKYEKFRPDIIHSGKNNIRNSILLSFYGIDPPAPNVAQDLVEKINEDLEKATLNEFVRVMKINPNYIGLIPEDIHFIQKDHTLPTYKFTCAIPKELYSVINAFRHYLDQHMRNFLAIPKYENLSLYEFAYDFEVLKGENISKSCSNVKAFKSCPNIYDSNEDFARIVSNFYLYAKAYNEEKSELGIAAIEFKFIKAETKKSLTLNDLAKQEVNYHIRELLTENLDSIKAKINLRADSEISNSIIEEISPENGAQIVVLQFNIWETGNINIKEFRRKMNNVVQQSINDIYTEYSVLSRSCFENNTLLEKTPFSSNYSSTACILPPVRQKHVSGYSTLPTYKLQQIPGVNESIVDDYSPFIRKRSASDSYYVSGSLIDPLTLLNLYSEEEIDLSIYYEPVTINNPTTFYENGSDVAVEAEPPIAENREHSNSDDASSSFHIRRSSTINPGSSKRSSTDRDEPVAFRGQRSKTMPSGRRIIETILGTHEASGVFARSAVGNIEEVVENETDNAPTNIEYLNPLFMQNLLEWFDYIDDQPIRDNYSKCYQRTEMDIDSKIVIDSTHKVLEEKVLEAMPQNDFIHCQSINTLSKGNLVPGKLKVLLNEDVKPIYKRFDHGQIERGNENVVSHVSILFNYKLQKDIVKCSRNSKGSITRRIHSSSKSNQALRDMQYLVGLDPFVPRQHMLLIVIRGLKIILYTYNISPDLCISLKQSFVRTIQWHNAKSKMFKVIHLQKLGIYHLSPMVPKKDYSDVYDVFINKNPDALMDLDYPPSLLEIPDYSSYPSSYGKHIFRMFRDSPEIRLAPSNAFAENQYDQYRKLRADISHELLHRFKLQKFYSDVKEGNVEFEENLFKEALQAFKQVHFVYSPMLMFESWRSKIAEIRSFRGMANTSVEDKTAPRQSTNEKHIYKLQYDLANEYRTYLLSLGWSDLRFKYVCEESQLRNFCDSQYDPSKPFSPNIWLTKTCAAGMFMANVFFRKPYFCFYIYMWSCEENIKPTHQASNVMRKAAVFENVENAKLLEEIKIDLIRKSHVHSFTYDFHLRVADKHLIHRNDLIFPDDYSTHLYLHNFLKYYEYRPPCSRNCVYEAIYENKNMKIEATKVWNLIIDHHKTNKDSNVFVLQNGDCMLVQEEEIELCYHKYKYVKILFKVPVKPYRSNQLNLKVYIMLISKSEIFPILEEFEINAPDTIDVEKHWVSTVTFDLPEEIIVEDESEEEPEEPVLDNYGSELIFVTPSQIHITPKPVSNNSEIRITPIRKDPPKSETKNKIRNEDGMFVKNESEENADKKNKDQIDLEYIEIRGRNRRIEYDALNSYEYHNLYCFNENVVSSDEDNEELNIDEEEMELDLNIEDEQEFEEDNSFEFNNDYDYRNYQEQLLQVDYNNFDMLSSRNTRPELIRMKSYSEKQVSKAIQLRPRSRSYTSEAYRHFEHENEQRIPPLLLAQNDIRIYNDNERIDPNACNNTNIFAAKKLLNLSDSRVKYKSYENDINEEDETLDINSITTKEKQKIVIVPRENAAYIHHLQPDQKVLQEALEKRAIKIVELLKQEIGLSEFGLRKNRMWDLATRTRNKMDRKRRRTRNDTNIENGPRRAPTDPLPPITLGEIVYKKMPPDDLVELFDILEKFDVEDENNTNCDMSRLLRLINFENFMNFALQQFDDTHSIYFENNGEYLFIISRNNENLAMIFYLSPEYKLKVYVAFKDIPKYNKYRQKDKAAISEIKCVCDEAINVVMQYHWKCLATDTISGLRF